MYATKRGLRGRGDRETERERQRNMWCGEDIQRCAVEQKTQEKQTNNRVLIIIFVMQSVEKQICIAFAFE